MESGPIEDATDNRVQPSTTLFQLFGERGSALIVEHLCGSYESMRPNLRSHIARERRAQAHDEFVSCFGQNVAYDPALKDEYGKRATLLHRAMSEKRSQLNDAVLLRLPVMHPHSRILHVVFDPFDDETEKVRVNTFRDVYTPENIIRGKRGSGENTNAKVTEWSNGEITISIGNDMYTFKGSDAASDMQLVVDKQTLCEAVPSESPHSKNIDIISYRSVAKQLQPAKALRLMTPLHASSVGEALKKDRCQKKYNKLEHLSSQAKRDSQAFSTLRQGSQEIHIYDPNEAMVHDIIAQKHHDSAKTISRNLLKEIEFIETMASQLGVINQGEVLTACRALREVFPSDQINELQNVQEQCTSIRRMYKI